MTNQFNKQLQKARKKQRFLFASLAVLFLIGLIIIAFFVFISNGTRIEIQPAEVKDQATLRIIDGVAIITGETLYSISKHPVVAISADGFQEKTQVLGDHDFGKVMTITLKPLPAKLKLRTNVVDNNISWLINGTTVSMANVFEYDLDAGNYELTVSHPHYHEITTMLSLARGEIFQKRFDLVAINGTINIHSIPSGANVSVSMRNMGVTPLVIPLTGGYHKLTLDLSNYESITDTIEISRIHSSVNRNYRMKLKKAAVSVTVKPDKGELLLDGIVVKAEDNLVFEAEVRHRLTYSRKGYFTESKILNLSAGEKQKVSFDLKREMGQVDIESFPEAEVILNGKSVGTTPLDLSLDAVEQEITLRKPGYRSSTSIITPSASNKKKISVILVSEKVARLEEAPNQYTNKVGGVLKLFTPNDMYEMGAKRSEPGQRANEFLKKIKLTKAFYAGLYEVTNAEYKPFDPENSGNPKEPITSVSWMDAAAYCNWLSELEGFNPVYDIKNNQLLGVNMDSDGYRLLTEAEWEWLARKAGKEKQSTFVWGDEQLIPKKVANIADESAKGKVKVFFSKYNDGFPSVAPAGSFTIEKSGLYDLGGNVSEWTNDGYSVMLPDTNTVFQDPVNSPMSRSHVIKGANWRSGSVTEIRPSYREGISNTRDDLGFRIGRYVY